ncbi:phage major capsid protein [Ligilactobacillus sp. LYQ135]
MPNADDIRTLDDVVRALPTEDGNLKIRGTAIVFDEPSQDMGFIEYIEPEAVRSLDFSKTMLLYNHETGKILARANAGNLKIEVTERGVDFEAELPQTTLAKDVYEDVRSGNLQGCSFGFRIAKDGDDWDTRDDGTIVHTIRKIDNVAELSITPIPAYLQTSVGVQRSLEKMKEEIRMAEEKKQETAKNEESEEIRALKEKNSNLEKENEDLKKKLEESKKEDSKGAKKEPEKVDDEGSGESEKESEPKKKDVPKDEKAKEVKRNMEHKVDITPESQINTQEKELRNFRDYLENGSKYDTRAVTGVGLPQGQVIIPKTILTPEHKVYQFPRLGSLVRTVSVKTTTGTLPLFNLVGDKLAEHTEFSETTGNNAPQVDEIDWKLKSYTGKYVFSQELISDSTYDWQSELSNCLIELRDNTEDAGIMTALTTNPAHKKDASTDVIKDLKTALNVNLQPLDSAQATIVVSQSAFNYLDNMVDKIGRPLINSNLTEGMGKQLLGHQLVVVPDTLFPSASQGDANFVVAPLQKAVINFKQSEITGQFQDTYDVWYKALGIFLREDIVSARPDLVTTIKADTDALAAAASTQSSK